MNGDTLVNTHFEVEVPGQGDEQWIFYDTFSLLQDAITAGRNYEDNVGHSWRVVQVQCKRTVLRQSGVYPEKVNEPEN